MQEHIDRVKWDIKNLFNRTDTNPYKPDKPRKALQDLPHAIVNVPVEFVRSNAQWSTKFAIIVIAVLLLIIINLAGE